MAEDRTPHPHGPSELTGEALVPSRHRDKKREAPPTLEKTIVERLKNVEREEHRPGRPVA